jgi:undecaprenyl-diphosphatase
MGAEAWHARTVAWPAGIQALDERLLLSVHGAPAVLVPLFYLATIVGGGWGLLALVPYLIRQATRVRTLWLLGAIVTQSALVSSLKSLVGRVRPCDALGWCDPLVVGSPGGHSFPSGHAAGSFAFAAFVSLCSPRWAPLAFAWAALVAASRCVLGVHYPSDVLAGALLGSAVGFGFARVALRREAAVRSATATSGAAPPGASPAAPP